MGQEITSGISGSNSSTTWNGHSSLCLPCRSIFSGNRQGKPLGVTAKAYFLQTLKGLQASAESGACHLCYIRWYDLSRKEREDLRGCTKVTFGFWRSSVGDGIAFEYFYARPPENGKACLTKSILLKSLDEISGWENEVNDARTTDNEKSFELALTWIYNCLENHEYCNRSLPLPENRILPGRLINVGDWPNVPPRLCATDGLPLETNYMTLSHCWSSYVPLRLTTSTLENFQDHLDTSALPQTFKDAIKITATLGIQYLWIDSLCIIQDSEQDWTEQAALMGDIYHNSWCNIAATAARDARRGCFMERNPLAVRKCQVEANWNFHPKQTLSCSGFDSWDNSVSNTLLHSRAWVVQELVLAPRVLHFGEQLYWECLEQRASETFPTSLPNDRRTKTSLDIHSLRHEWNLEKSLKLNRYLLWNLFVKRYSECDLTKPELDKLVAISGLARKLIVDGDQYVAGLWREILSHQLMWSVQDPGTGTEPGNSSIPSWSWASMNRRVKMHAPSEIAANNPILIRITSVGIPLLGKDPFGQIKGGGVLRLEGPLVKTTIRRCIENNRSNEKWWLGTALAVVKPDRGSFADGTPVFCLTIEDALSFGSKVGIVLQPTGKLPGQFYRRGRFTIFDVKFETRYVQEFMESHQSPLEPEEYEDKLGIDPSSGLLFYRISLV